MVLTQSDSVEVHENAIIKNRNLSPIYKRRSANKFSQKKSSNYFLRPTKRKLFSDDISSSSSSSGKTVSEIEPCKINFNVQTKELVIRIEPIPYSLLTMYAESKRNDDQIHVQIKRKEEENIGNSPIFHRKKKRAKRKGRHEFTDKLNDDSISTERSFSRRNRKLKICRRSSRSPVLIRECRVIENCLDLSSLSQKSVSSLSLNDEEKVQLSDSDEASILSRSFSTKNFPKKKCFDYPKNVERCVDCLKFESTRYSKRSATCRFQNCRKLKTFGENHFETDGFTAFDSNDEFCHEFDSNETNFLHRNDAEYLLKNLFGLYSNLLLHEENQRSTRKSEKIIWKRSLPGWREICDECSTTLFNCHLMCRECGFIVCVECFDDSNRNNSEKRKKTKRFCSHLKSSFSLAEIIPWKILVKLKGDCLNLLSISELEDSAKEKCENFFDFLRKKRASQLAEGKTDNILDSNCEIEFFCDGRLPVFNEWKSCAAQSIFRKFWNSSSPVVVKNVHKNLSQSLWKPSSFKENMIDRRETPVLWDCETLAAISTDENILTRFWDGFEQLDVRLRDEENGDRTRILKLKDWPTKRDFGSVFPDRLHDLMTNIPFGDYTRRSYVHKNVRYFPGPMNIVERLPPALVKPDLGPKMYIAYSNRNSQLKSCAARKAGTTNLHIDVSDAVNVLVYVGIAGQGENGVDKTEEKREVEEEILKAKLDENQIERLNNGELPGALWHLFSSDDVPKIRNFFSKKLRKFNGSDFIHDQTSYLEREDLDVLEDNYDVKSYSIVQFLGDAVFIPSGCPHQVRNLHSCIKIAEDFVSPENLDRCLITTDEFRFLSKNHTNHADILQAKNILYYTLRDVSHSLRKINEND